MKISGIKKEHVEVEVDDCAIYDAFLLLLKRRLDVRISNEHLFLDENNDLCFWEVCSGHNRDWEKVRVEDRHPDIKITDDMMRIMELYTHASNGRRTVLERGIRYN